MRAADRRVPPPVIVLVRPQLGENIGKAARAMLNFGLTELRLVAPRDGWPNPDAGPAAIGRRRRAGRARQVFDSVAEAVADCAHVYATTVRKRGVIKPVVDAASSRAARSAPRRALGDPVRARARRAWRPTMSRSPARSSPCRSTPNSAASTSPRR